MTIENKLENVPVLIHVEDEQIVYVVKEDYVPGTYVDVKV